MRPNQVKQKIKQGQSVFGTFVKLNDPAIVEVLALAGFDFFVLDNEHVAMDWAQITNMVRAAEAFNITPLIRVRENRPVEILQCLDLGYAGVQVPNVDTAAEARELVSSVKYGPQGSRGLSPSIRACRYGTMSVENYTQCANENTLVVSHCETETCVNNLSDILAVEGVDVIFLGPMDLSQSLGIPGDLANPRLKSTIELVKKKVLTEGSGKAVGTVAGNAEAAKKLVSEGVQYLLISSDQGLVLNSGKSILENIKGK